MTYQVEKTLDPLEFADLLKRSTLAERRPDDPERLRKMVENANLIVTARDDNGQLMGVSRALTDFAFCTYLSDLAVDESLQRQGIGRELIRQTKLASPEAKLILLAAPKAVEYYPRIGMTAFAHCFLLDRVEDLH